MLHHLGDEHIDVMKQAISSWGCGKARIIIVDFSSGRLTSDGVGYLLSLPHNTLSDLKELDLSLNKLDSKSCASSLPVIPASLERLWLWNNQIGCDGVHLLSQSLHNTTLRVLDVNGSNIGDRWGCSLAKAMRINKGLVRLYLWHNPLGEKIIQ